MDHPQGRRRVSDLTVVIATRNRAKTLAGALIALSQQDLGPDVFDVIVADNGSTDATVDVCNSFSKALPQLRLVRDPRPGQLVGWHRALYAGIYPVLVGFNSIPKVAVVPVLILWFGLGEVPAIMTAFLISFFPIVVNVATGLATTEPELEDVLRALGASKLDIMRKVGIPRSLPYFFGSLKVAITLAFVGAVVSETVGANKGIGKLMLDAQSAFQVPIVFAGLLVLAFLGIVLYAMTALIEQRFTGWAFRGQANY